MNILILLFCFILNMCTYSFASHKAEIVYDTSCPNLNALRDQPGRLDIAAEINGKHACAKCGPLLPSNYRIDVSEPEHVIFPDNPEIWKKSKDCPDKCMFNHAKALLVGFTQGNYALVKGADGKFELNFRFPNEKKTYHVKALAGQPIESTGCIVITQEGFIVPCQSEHVAKLQLAQFRKEKAEHIKKTTVAAK